MVFIRARQCGHRGGVRAGNSSSSEAIRRLVELGLTAKKMRNEWRPIETAPTGVTVVRLLCKGHWHR